jgi:serine/threonine-protein kinase HipA
MKKIEVWADWYFLHEPQKVGVLSAVTSRGSEVFSFDYDHSWLKGKYKFQIDPQLQLYKGAYHPSNGGENFGAFTDSSPDRWGRTLLLRREALQAKQENRAIKTLMPSDYLLGVYDQTRMGGLRFKLDGPFLDDNKNIPTPPWTSIRELEQASLFLESNDSESDPNFSAQLSLLFAPGSSLGGARPKASVLDPYSHLWIAKFPSLNDLKDVGAWEAVVHELARKCKICLPEAQAQKFFNKHHTFLVKRFDRLPSGKRVHVASAMTLLQHKDGDNYHSGASYLEIVDFIIQSGAPSKVDTNLEELWKRIVFSIAISNSDDHLRNHAFLLSEEGWELSPAYDINPNEMATGLSLNITWESNALDFDLAISVADDFRVSQKKARELVKHTKKEVSEWRTVAHKYGISRSEQQRMEKAFKV